MVYRDEREALRQRAEAAEREIGALRPEAERARELERRVRRLERELAEKAPPSQRRTAAPSRVGPVAVAMTLASGVVGLAGWIAWHAAVATSDAPARAHDRKAATAEAPSDVFTARLSVAPLLFDRGPLATYVAVWGVCEDANGTTAGLRTIDEITGRPAWTACRLGPAGAGELQAFLQGEMVIVWSPSWLAALDIRTGAELWERRQPGEIAVACEGPQDNLVQITAPDEARTARLLDAATGETAKTTAEPWSCEPHRALDSWTSASNGPGRHVIDAASGPRGDVDTFDFDVVHAGYAGSGTVALGVRNHRSTVGYRGNPVWTRELPLPEGVAADGLPPSSAVTEKALLFVAYQPSREAGLHVAALAIATGAVVWHAPVGRPEWTLHAVSGLAVTDRSILVYEPWHLYGVSRTEGAQRFDLP